MPAHLTLQPNMLTLKEALRLMTSYYPELLHRVYFYRPNLAFQLVFAVFSMWLPASTRAKLVMVRAGEERRHFFSKDAPGGGCDPASTPRELGGTGPSLGGAHHGLVTFLGMPSGGGGRRSRRRRLGACRG